MNTDQSQLLTLLPQYCVNKIHFISNTVESGTFACLNFREFVILGLFTKSRIRELLISMIGSAPNNNIREILKFAHLSLLAKFAKSKTSRILPDLQYLNEWGHATTLL